MNDVAVFEAGCGRRADGPGDVAELAYLELAFPECPGCEFRIEPGAGRPFCRWMRLERPDPLAPLLDLEFEG